MAISFNRAAVGLSPYQYIEIDNSAAFGGPSNQPQRLLFLTFDETTTPAPAVAEAPDRPTRPRVTQPLSDDSPRDELRTVADLKARKIPDDLARAIAAMDLVGTSVEAYGMILRFDSLKDEQTIVDILTTKMPELSITQIAVLKHNDILLKALKSKLKSWWESHVQLDGHVFVAKYGAIEDLCKEARQRNDPHLSMIPLRSQSDDPAAWAASFAALNALCASDPSKPYQNITVNGLKTIADSGFKLSERDTLLSAGVATWRKQGDDIIWDRLVTTYTKNEAGADDPSFRDLETLQTLSYLRFDIRQALLRDFPRHKLARDDFPYAGDVLTPKVLKMWLIARYRQQQARGLVQDPDGVFSKNLRVEVSDNQPGKVDVYMVPYLMGQYRQTQIKLAFKI